jgi:hypothetical protein
MSTPEKPRRKVRPHFRVVKKIGGGTFGTLADKLPKPVREVARPLTEEEIARGDRWLNVFRADGEHFASTIVENGPKMPESYKHAGTTEDGSEHYTSDDSGRHYIVSLHYLERMPKR